MSSITLSTRIDSDTLHLPELLAFVGHHVEIVVRDSVRFPERDSDRSALLKTLREICQSCRDTHWDGENAEAVSPETGDIARRFLESLPRAAPLPNLSPEPDGQLNFEWYQAPRRLLTVSVGASGTLYWAALMDSEDPRGSCPFVDQFPQTLLYWIGQIYG